MALSNYGELKTSIADWLDREDLTARVPDFVRLAESRLNTDPRTRTRYTETTIEYPNGSLADPVSPITLPSDFREVITIRLGNRTLKRLPDTVFFDRVENNNTRSDLVETYTIFDNKLYLAPWATEAGSDWTGIVLTVLYHESSDLTSGADSGTTGLLTGSPNVYLFGALAQAGIYLKDREMMTVYEQSYQDTMNLLQREHRRAATTDLMSVTSVGASSHEAHP